MATPDIEIINNIIKLLRVSISSCKIYPSGSKIIIDRVNFLHSAMTKYLQTHDSITISQLHGKLLIDTQELKAADTEMVSILVELGLTSITFDKGVTVEDLLFVMETFSKRKEQIKSAGGFPQMLAKKDVKHISIDQVKYVAVQKGEEVVKKISNLVDNLSIEPNIFTKSLHEIYNTIDHIKDDGTKENMIKMLAKKLATLEPSQIREFFEQEMPSKVESVVLREAVISALPVEKVRGISSEIIKWYDEIKRTAKSELDAAEQLDKLRNLINKILTAPSARNIPFEFFEELLRTGLLEKIPDWAKKEQPSLLQQVGELMEKDASALLDPSILDGLPDMIKKLCQADLTEDAEKLTKKLTENLRQSSIKTRSDTVRTLMKINDIFVAAQKEKILRFVQSQFMSEIEKENNIDIYSDLAELLRKRVFQLLLNNEYEEAIGIISIFKRSCLPEVETDKNKVQITNKMLKKVADDLFDLLVNDMKSGLKKRQDSAMKIIAMLGDKSVDAFISVIKESDEYRTRKAAAFALQNMGEAAVQRLIDNITPEVSTQVIIRLMECLSNTNEKVSIDKLTGLLKYPAPQVKRILMQYLYKMYPGEAKLLLIGQLDDENINVCIDAVRFLSRLKSTQAVDKIGRLISIGNTTLQEEICIALGEIGDEKAVPVLAKLSGSKKWFGFGGKTVSPVVRVRAVRSLGKFLNNSKVKKILKKCVKDKNNYIAQAAKEILNGV